jgi:hypothetical protein
MTQAMEYGYEIWIMECKEFVQGFEGTSQISQVWWEFRRAEAPNLQENTHFSTERGTRIMN